MRFRGTVGWYFKLIRFIVDERLFGNALRNSGYLYLKTSLVTHETTLHQQRNRVEMCYLWFLLKFIMKGVPIVEPY